MWSYKCYITEDRPDLWAVWYRDQSERVQAKHDSVFRLLEQQNSWGGPHVKKLRGKNYKGLFEVILNTEKQWRIFGFYEPGRVFVIAAIGHHKDSYYPKDIMDIARARMAEIKLDSSKAAKCDRPS